ncbi:hypothetical protein HOV48_gp062 [Rheinheimera phage Barba21A]|uniref:Uncharacterized protein n=1 Tax=Rheinheimera phage Barba21A TaxID=2849598 RepID=A0A4P8N7J7_9CAUD|nr:hypothetical protein HOV48_gp062 [Rheinheimera phage Barba21A]QCQ62322.1 hypothetical protein Barba21A_gp062 [Rheinheimera phage Barba21A]
MSEIEKRISELEQALIAHKIGWQESTERNNKLQAQVELLRTSLDDILEDMQLSMELSESDCDVWKGRIKDTLSGTPAQCLAEIRAEAVERATNLYAHRFGNDAALNEVGIDIIRKSKEYIHPNGLRDYVEQLRSGTDVEYSQTTKESK